MGNSKSNSIYNPNEIRNPPPPNLEDTERDSELEQYIRCKYASSGHNDFVLISEFS
jgi:stromal membrane-associated protein